MASDPCAPSLTLNDRAFSCTCGGKATLSPTPSEQGAEAIRFVAEHASCPPLPQFIVPSTVFDSGDETPNEIELQPIGIECLVYDILAAHESGVF